MPSTKRRQRNNKRKSTRTRQMRGGGCGCGGNPLFQRGGVAVGAVPATLQFEPASATMSATPLSIPMKGGRQSKSRRNKKSRSNRRVNMRGGGWDSFFTGNYTTNPIANFFTTSGAVSNANTLYGANEVNPSPSSQSVAYYNNPHNIRAA